MSAAQTLVSLSTVGTKPEMSDNELAEKCKAEMAQWFGAEEVASWQLLRVYRIPFAQPNQVQHFQQDTLCQEMSLTSDLLHSPSEGRSTWGWKC